MQFSTRTTLTLAVVSLAVSGPVGADEPSPDVLTSDSFETGTKAPEGWRQGPKVPGVKYVYDRRTASEGERSLSLQKSANRYFPIAGWARAFPYETDKPAVRVSAKVKAAKATKAVIDVVFLDENEKWIKHEWAAYIGQKESGDPAATHDWKEYAGAVEIPAGTKQIGIVLQIYGPGKVWFDELEARCFDSVKAAEEATPAAEAKTSLRNRSPEPTRTRTAPIEIRTASGGLARYLLVPPDEENAQPSAGFPLLLVLPGGDGSADFHPFVQQIHEHALNGRFIVAQPIAPPHIVWPTPSSQHTWGTTDESLRAIIDDVAQRHPVDLGKVIALAWSSSGPAVYSALLQEDSPLNGALIAMSVFKPGDLPPLTHAAGRRIYLLHSPDDAVCPYRMAEEAETQLTAAGAQVALVDYSGGHGWHGPVYDNIRTGIDWLRQAE